MGLLCLLAVTLCRYRGWRVLFSAQLPSLPLCFFASLLLCFSASFATTACVDDDGDRVRGVRGKKDRQTRTVKNSQEQTSPDPADPLATKQTRSATATRARVKLDSICSHWLSCSVLFRCWAHGDCGRGLWVLYGSVNFCCVKDEETH
ncbi:hypothetical protein BZA77DRAFT_305446 [Pyronema omphalodes]|nr:hypothetical protein BZA77DRAFT_305446 [Pyronema omphalodes]